MIKNNDLLNKIEIYYINLDESIERNKYMKSQLENHKYTRIRAIDTKCNIFNKYINLGVESKRYTNKSTVLACLLSHLYAIKMAYENKLDNVIIFEDDVDLYIFNNVYKHIDDFWYNNNNNMDVLQLFTSNVQFYYNKLNNLYVCDRDTSNWSTCGYIINYNGMSKIMKLYDYEKQMFDFNIDYKIPNSSGKPPYVPDHIDLNINNEYLISDYFIYSICNTKILNLPILNTNSNEFNSTIDTSHDWSNWEEYINNNKDTIINIIKNYKSD